MSRIPAGPETEAIVVLAGENRASHTGSRQSLRPLLRIKMLRTKNRGGFCALPPLPVRKSIYGKMEKTVKFQLLVTHLPLGGHHPDQLFFLLTDYQ